MDDLVLRGIEERYADAGQKNEGSAILLAGNMALTRVWSRHLLSLV
jgi:hypothetical protein